MKPLIFHRYLEEERGIPASLLKSPRFAGKLKVEGNPLVLIVETAKSQEVDLIVIGTHGRTGLAHVLLGSVAETVVRKAPCPVLTVKHPEHEFVVP